MKKKKSKKIQTKGNKKNQELGQNEKFCKISTFCIWDRPNYRNHNIFVQ